MNLPKHFKNRIREFESLGQHTHLRIGGQARYWYEPKDKKELGRFLKQTPSRLSLFVIGAGSNLLLNDGLINKIFVYLNSPDFNRMTIKGTTVSVGSGVRLSRLVAVLKTKNLGGYEFLAGIPGTIGGALAMNAGAKVDAFRRSAQREMKDITIEVVVLNKSGRLRRLKKNDLKFSYRNSNLKPFIILSAKLKLKKTPKENTQRKIRAILKQRSLNQEGRYPSAGSFFKNPGKKMPAGGLIDACHLKGLKVGGAQVSTKHANFIVNANRAKAKDVVKLMEIIQRKVYNRFKIKLKPEVQIVS